MDETITPPPAADPARTELQAARFQIELLRGENARLRRELENSRAERDELRQGLDRIAEWDLADTRCTHRQHATAMQHAATTAIIRSEGG